jgi:hypothetical protein
MTSKSGEGFQAFATFSHLQVKAARKAESMINGWESNPIANRRVNPIAQQKWGQRMLQSEPINK